MTPAPLEQPSLPAATPAPPERRGWISLALGAGTSLVAFWLILRSVDLNLTFEILSSSQWVLVLAACLMQMGAMGVGARRWQALLTPYPTRFWTLLQILFSAHLLNTLLPFKLGTVARVLLAAETEKLNVGFVLGSVALEKVLDTFVMLLLLLLLTPFVPMPVWVRDSLTASVLLVVVGLIALASVRRLREPLLTALARLERRIFKRESVRLSDFVRGILESLANLTQQREAMVVLGWTVVIWAIGCTINQVLFYALGINLPPSAAIFVMVVLQIGTRVPALPANLGVFHFLVILALSVYGVQQSTALAYAILLHLVVFIVPAVVAVGFAVPLGARLVRLVTDKNARAL